MQTLNLQVDQIITKITVVLDNYIELEQAYLQLVEERNYLTQQLEEQKKAIHSLQEKITLIENGEIDAETENETPYTKRKREHLKAAINDVIKEVDKCLTTLNG